MLKVLELGPYFYDTFEPVMQVLDPRRTYGEKVASEALDYIKNVEAKEGKTIVLVIAMGAGEYWGANRNGDYFPEEDLKKNFKNFETQFSDEGKINGGALIYKHHKNKLAKGDPWYGIVRKAFYNDKMHRVELLLEVDNKKAPDIVDRIENGDYPAVSMGVRIPFDICSICGNKSPRVSEYCEHLKYQMNKILGDGRKAYAINGKYDYSKHSKPLNFFDISFVFRPADQTGYMIKKVAEFSEESYEPSAFVAEKMASHAKISEEMKKLSDMNKYIRGDVAAVKDESGELKMIDKFMKGGLGRAVSQMEEIDDEKIERLSKFPMADVLTTLAKNNIILTTPEFLKLVVKKLTGKEPPRQIIDMFTELQAEMFEELADDPEKVEELAALPMFQGGKRSSEVEEIIEPVKSSRDLSTEAITKKADIDMQRTQFGIHRGGILESHTVTAPDGRKFVASTGAIEDAQFWEMLKDVSSSMATAAALAGVYAYLSKMGPTGKAIAPVALAATAYMGWQGLKSVMNRSWTGELVSDDGRRLPRSTVMIEKKGSLSDKAWWMLGAPLAPVGATVLLNRYYKNKLEKGTAGQYATTLGKYLDTAGEYAYHHPFITTGGLMLTETLPAEIHRQFKNYLRSTKP